MTAFTHPGFTGPLVGFVLNASPLPPLDELEAALAGEFAGQVHRHEQPATPQLPAVTTLSVSDGDTVVLVTPVDAPLPDVAEAVAGAHPMWWTDTTPVAEHRSHLIVNTWRPEDAVATLEQQQRSATLFSAVATLLLERPEASAFFYGNGGSTFPADIYAAYVTSCLDEGALATDVWVSTWIDQDGEGTFSATTLGLPAFGHADVHLLPTQTEPSRAFILVKNLVAHLIMSGDHLMPGDVIPLEGSDATLTVGEPQEGLLTLRWA